MPSFSVAGRGFGFGIQPGAEKEKEKKKEPACKTCHKRVYYSVGTDHITVLLPSLLRDHVLLKSYASGRRGREK